MLFIYAKSCHSYHDSCHRSDICACLASYSGAYSRLWATFLQGKRRLWCGVGSQRKAPLRGGAEKCYNFQIWVYLVNCLLRGLSNFVHHFCPFCVGVRIVAAEDDEENQNEKNIQ